MAGKKPVLVCLNLMSVLSHIELVHCDPIKGQFLVTDSEELMFDPATRELLDDYTRFKQMITRMYERNKIPLRTPTSLIIPSFFTRQYNLPAEVLGEDVRTILVSEAERFYVFKKIDPEIAYVPLKNGQLLYSAYPKQPFDQLLKAMIDLKIPLVSIEINYSAILRGLTAMGAISNEITNFAKWGLMVVSDYHLFMAVVEGAEIENTTESPLSLQNMEDNALLSEITSDFQQFFGYEILTRIVIVNNAQKVVSSQLIENLGFEGPKQIYDQNQDTLASRGATSEDAFPCTLEAVGGNFLRLVRDVPPIEFTDILSAIQINTGDDSRIKFVSFILIGAGIVLYGLQFLTGLVFTNLKTQQDIKTSMTQNEIAQTQNSLSIGPQVKAKLYVKKAALQNYRISNAVTRIGESLPPDAWLKEVLISSPPDLKSLSVTVKGEALTSDPLNTLLNQLNGELKQSPLNVSVTAKQEGSQQYFDFTLKNTPIGLSSAIVLTGTNKQ